MVDDEEDSLVNVSGNKGKVAGSKRRRSSSTAAPREERSHVAHVPSMLGARYFSLISSASTSFGVASHLVPLVLFLR